MSNTYLPGRALLLLLGFVGLLATSCTKNTLRGNGTISTEVRMVPAFQGVETHYNIKAVVTYGTVQEVRITGYSNLLAELQTEVENGILILKFPWQYNYVRNGNVVVYIQMPFITKSTIHGSGDINISGFTNGSHFTGFIYGSGDISVSNSSFQKAMLYIYGSGDIAAENLQATEAEASVFGSGDIFIRVEQNLKALIQGSGDVNYWGNPQVEVTDQGSGNLRKRI